MLRTACKLLNSFLFYKKKIAVITREQVEQLLAQAGHLVPAPLHLGKRRGGNRVRDT
jgi:hypothetical protein